MAEQRRLSLMGRSGPGGPGAKRGVGVGGDEVSCTVIIV